MVAAATLTAAMSTDDALHVHHLRRAGLLALRGHGGAEPNPMVGCVIVSPNGATVGWGYHRVIGGPHAEIVALQRAGRKAQGSTLYCTLEPCNHQGRTGPCSQAVINAGVARVVIARRDPWQPASGGLDRIAAAGIDTRVIESCSIASHVCEPFAHRVHTGLPWVTVKWAQTVDGRIATRPPLNESQWISGEASRRMVHRERGRVDAILTGIGTVLKDDPLLSPRNVRLRRPGELRAGGLPLKVVIDPRLQTPPTAKIFTSMSFGAAPTIIICDKSVLDREQERASLLGARGAQVLGFSSCDGDLPLPDVLRKLASDFNVTHVLVEAGSGVMGRLFRQRLVNEAWVFTAPLLLGDEHAMPAVSQMTSSRLTDGIRMTLWSLRRRGGDSIARYLVTQ